MSKQLDEKNFPTLSCALEIKAFCVVYPWRFVLFRRPSHRFCPLSSPCTQIGITDNDPVCST